MRRRDFIKRLGIVGGLGSMTLMIKSTPLKAFAQPLFNIKSTNGKILVILQLKGGNDGLNTIIPYENDIYYSSRPLLSIKKSDALYLNDDFGFHPSLIKLKELYDDGIVSIIQNVGYANPDRSHFRSTDIWLSGSDSDQFIFDGWTGRYLTSAFPEYPDTVPEHPMAIQLGSVQSLLLESEHGSMGVSFEDPNIFYQLVQGSEVDSDPPPGTIAGEELKYLKQVAAQSIQYADVIKETADSGTNKVDYPDTKIADQLAIIAKLIAGGLTTPVYLTTLSGFDTHAIQTQTHAGLLLEISEAIHAFQKDIELLGVSDKVVLMTISEFGRRLYENGSQGTDHGTAAPLIVIGSSVSGGIIGTLPDFTDLDESGDIKYEYDFRQIYATMLRDHFQLDEQNTTEILFKEFSTLPILNNPTSLRNNMLPVKFQLGQNFPNPFNPTTQIGYSTAVSGNLRLDVFDSLGRKVKTIINKFHTPGNYSVSFNAAHLSSGIYYYRIEAEGFRETKKMMLTK